MVRSTLSYERVPFDPLHDSEVGKSDHLTARDPRASVFRGSNKYVEYGELSSEWVPACMALHAQLDLI